MNSALYYPNIQINSEHIMKMALLHWDSLEFISPFANNHPYYEKKEMSEAYELIAKPHIPSNEEKEIAHTKIMDLITSKLPDWFLFNPNDKEIAYHVYPGKLLDKTWDAIYELKYAGREINSQVYDTASSFGLTIMSILADACAGSQKITITDKADSYSSLMRYLTAYLGGEYVQNTNEIDKLVTIPMWGFAINKIPFKRLVDLRKREYEKNDTFLRDLRLNYKNAVEQYVDKIKNEAKTHNDLIEINRVFEQSMNDDIVELKKQLKMEIVNIILSKEILVAILAGVGLLVEPISSTIIGTGALVKKDVEYRSKRKEVLRKHPTSWLYVSENERQYL
ncbi:MAG: hypothetical protein C0412_02120 [Flavobacterium sp.]|nr:hypothetical protein [Flavobacterium sp.]